MTEAQKQNMQECLLRLASVVDEASELKLRVDRSYGKILEKEVETYRQLIAIWRRRLSPGKG